MKLTNKTILLLIIFVAAVLRFYDFFEIPFTHDEFSALFRTHFSSFSELIEKGVKIDGHPAGIQVFLYYWTKLWGYSEWIVKAPFIIFGILSVLLIYLIAKDWYNETVALVSASFLASTQYTIMYSQIARPYISGLFFSLLMVYFWTKIMLTPQKRFYLNSFLFVIAASISTYNHHFSLLFAAIVGLSGLFFIKEKYLIRYIISGVCIILLYLPHVKIFFYQLNVGGVEAWLSKPHNDFIIDYLGYIFHFSIILFSLVLLIVLFGFFKIRKQDINYKYLILFTCWFLLPFLIGFFYSRYVNSVLQYSVLIFSFPYLFFILFGHLKPQNEKINFVIVLSVLSLNIFALFKERQHYKLFYHSSFAQIIIDHQKALNANDHIVSIIDSHKKITDYYIAKFGLDGNFTWYDSFLTGKEFVDFLEEKSQLSDYLYFGCLSSNDPLTVSLIQEYYPTIEWQNNYAGGTTYLFSKKAAKEDRVDILTFELKEKTFWSSIEEDKFIDTIAFSGRTSYLIDSKTEWSPTFSKPLKEVVLNENNFIDISVNTYLPERYDSIFLVASLESHNKIVYWECTLFDKFIVEDHANNKWLCIYHSMKLSDIYQNYPDVQLKIYIWNKRRHNFLIDDFKIEVRQGNPVIYGLLEKI